MTVRSRHNATSSRGKGKGGRSAYSSGRVIALLVPEQEGTTAVAMAPACKMHKHDIHNLNVPAGGKTQITHSRSARQLLQQRL